MLLHRSGRIAPIGLLILAVAASAVSGGLLGRRTVASLPEDVYNVYMTRDKSGGNALDYMVAPGGDLGVDYNLNEVDDLEQSHHQQPRGRIEEQTYLIVKTMRQRDKRYISYLTLCHFKICNMGRKRTTRYFHMIRMNNDS